MTRGAAACVIRYGPCAGYSYRYGPGRQARDDQHPATDTEKGEQRRKEEADSPRARTIVEVRRVGFAIVGDLRQKLRANACQYRRLSRRDPDPLFQKPQTV